MFTENKFSKKIYVIKTTNISYFIGRIEGYTASSVRNDTANPPCCVAEDTAITALFLRGGF
jgi:hypothetical protein